MSLEALDLLRRMPPDTISAHLNSLIQLRPDLAEDLLSSVDQPLQVLKCDKTKKPFLTCDYNRDEDSFRSPWSNNYQPPLEDGTVPSPKLRQMEEKMNKVIDGYREMYFEGGVSSVYLWDLDDGFAGVVLLKKTTENGGAWDSIHVFEAVEKSRTAAYKLTSTVILLLKQDGNIGSLDLSGNMTRQIESDLPLEEPTEGSHIANIGRLIEDMEQKMRNQLQEVYFGKTRDISNLLRTIPKASELDKDKAIQKEMVQGLKA